MGSEDEAMRLISQTGEGVVRIGVELTPQLVKLLTWLEKHGLQFARWAYDKSGRNQVSLKRLRYIARESGTGIAALNLEGLEPTDPRINLLRQELKNTGIRYSFDPREPGQLFIEANNEVFAKGALQRVGILVGMQAQEKLDTPAERQARDEARKALPTPLTLEEREKVPTHTIKVYSPALDIRQGLLEDNLARMGIPYVSHTNGELVNISFRSNQAVAVKALIDNLAANKMVTHFDQTRVVNYEDLTQAAMQYSLRNEIDRNNIAITEQDPDISSELTTVEKNLGEAPETQAIAADQESQALAQEAIRNEQTPGAPEASTSVPDQPAASTVVTQPTTPAQSATQPARSMNTEPITDKQKEFLSDLEKQGYITRSEREMLTTKGDVATLLNKVHEQNPNIGYKLDADYATKINVHMGDDGMLHMGKKGFAQALKTAQELQQAQKPLTVNAPKVNLPAPSPRMK